MNAPLYTTEILRLAAGLPEPTVLDREDGRAELRSPTCGSRVTVAVQQADGKIAALSLDVQACAFGQAASALMASGAQGKGLTEAQHAVTALEAWLTGESAATGFWPGIEALAPARPRRARHGAILLPFRALAAALEASR